MEEWPAGMPETENGPYQWHGPFPYLIRATKCSIDRRILATETSIAAKIVSVLRTLMGGICPLLSSRSRPQQLSCG
jgi:hypothetical protein